MESVLKTAGLLAALFSIVYGAIYSTHRTKQQSPAKWSYWRTQEFLAWCVLTLQLVASVAAQVPFHAVPDAAAPLFEFLQLIL